MKVCLQGRKNVLHVISVTCVFLWNMVCTSGLLRCSKCSQVDFIPVETFLAYFWGKSRPVKLSSPVLSCVVIYAVTQGKVSFHGHCLVHLNAYLHTAQLAPISVHPIAHILDLMSLTSELTGQTSGVALDTEHSFQVSFSICTQMIKDASRRPWYIQSPIKANGP